MDGQRSDELSRYIAQLLATIVAIADRSGGQQASSPGAGGASMAAQDRKPHPQPQGGGSRGAAAGGIPVKISSEAATSDGHHLRVANQSQEVFIAEVKGELEAGAEGSVFGEAEGAISALGARRSQPGLRQLLRGAGSAAGLISLPGSGLDPETLEAFERALANPQISLREAQDLVEDTLRRQGGTAAAEVAFQSAGDGPARGPDVERVVEQVVGAAIRRQGERSAIVRRAILESVIGIDDRVQVTNTTAAPWRYICSLEMQWVGRGSGLGTGWLAGPRTVITAGHCVYDRVNGLGWPDFILVTPGHNGVGRGSAPFGQYTSTSFQTVRGWAYEGMRECDYGAIILPGDATYGGHLVGDYTGYFSYSAMEDDHELAALLVNAAGYPYDYHIGTNSKPRLPFSLWKHNRIIAEITPELVFYDIDTYQGQSGAPVWWLQNGRRTVIGIHNYGTDPASESASNRHNSATRIRGNVKANIDWWASQP